MNVEALHDLATEWRDEAGIMRRRGAPSQADALESAADDLEERLREWTLEPLTMDDAEAESGYSRSTLERRIASGEITNAGRKGSPRILRRDLPKKGGSEIPLTDDGDPDVASLILARRT